MDDMNTTDVWNTSGDDFSIYILQKVLTEFWFIYLQIIYFVHIPQKFMKTVFVYLYLLCDCHIFYFDFWISLLLYIFSGCSPVFCVFCFVFVYLLILSVIHYLVVFSFCLCLTVFDVECKETLRFLKTFIS